MAEYLALISALKAAANLGNELVCYSDSMLVVKQMNGEWKVKHPNMRPLFRQATSLKESFKTIVFEHLPRTNRFIESVDRLANQELDRLDIIKPQDQVDGKIG